MNGGGAQPLVGPLSAEELRAYRYSVRWKKEEKKKTVFFFSMITSETKKERKVYKMILSLSCSVTLSYSLSHSFSCAGFYKFVVRDDVISPAGVRNFGTYDDVFEHVHSVARVRKSWATVVANKSGCANGPEAP